MLSKRFFRFSLLTLLGCFTTVAALCAAWVGYRERFERQQRICEQLVRDLGGERVIWIDPENTGRCGFYIRPQGLEFRIERNKSWVAHFYRGGLREVTAAYVTYARPNQMSPRAAMELKIREIAKLESLKAVVISSDDLTDDDLAALRRLPNLTSLDISCKTITEAGFRYLGEMRGLTKLSVGRWPLPSDLRDNKLGNGLTYLAKLPRLESLSLENVALEGAGLGTLPSLQDLRLFQCALSTVSLRRLADCKGLATLAINNSRFDATVSAEALGAMPLLRELELDHAEIDDDAFHKLPALCKLSLDSCKLSTAALQDVASVNIRCKLSLSQCKLSVDPSKDFPQFEGLESLSLSLPDNNSKDLMHALAQIKGLRKLDLHIGNDLQDVLFEAMPSLRQLDLFFEDGKITMEACKSLANCKGLECLTISRRLCNTELQEFADDELAALATLGNLKILDLQRVPLTQMQLSRLKAQLPSTHIFTEK